MFTHFDHTFSPLRDNNLDATLARFERAGFLVIPKKVRHPAGRLSGFVQLTSSYLEFLSVVDERAFAREATWEERYFRAHPRPYGFGALTSDAVSLHRTLSRQFAEMPPVVSRASVGGEEPAWSFCLPPPRAFPGAFVFALQYHGSRQGVPPQAQCGPNTIFALGGFVLCSSEPAAAIKTWRSTLREIARLRAVGPRLRLSGMQDLEWISPTEYRRRFGAVFQRSPGRFGDIAAVKLLCTNVDEACRRLAGEDFKCVRQTRASASFAPDSNTGFTFELIRSQPAKFLRALTDRSRSRQMPPREQTTAI
jgi:hypothetical protein